MAGSPQMLGAVLAGGESRRMGTDKANLELGGERLGERAVRVLRAELSAVVVVSRRLGEHRDLGADEIADRVAGRGPLGGLEAALVHADGRHVFALACDLPRVDRRLIAHLLAAAPTDDRERRPWAVAPTIGEQRQPLCAIYSSSCLPIVERHLDEGRLRMLDLAAAIDTTWIELDRRLPYYRADLLSNVNDRAAVARLAIAGE